LPPVEKSGEFHSLDAVTNPKTKKQAVEVCFYGTPGHFELFGDLGVIASLEQ
jgi:hypothetical protein